MPPQEFNSFTKKAFPLFAAGVVMSVGLNMETKALGQGVGEQKPTVPEFNMDHDTFVTDCVNRNFEFGNINPQRAPSILNEIIGNRKKLSEYEKKAKKRAERNNLGSQNHNSGGTETKGRMIENDKQDQNQNRIEPKSNTAELSAQITAACIVGTKPKKVFSLAELQTQINELTTESQEKVKSTWSDNMEEVVLPENWDPQFKSYYEHWLFDIKRHRTDSSVAENSPDWDKIMKEYSFKTLVPFSHFHKVFESPEDKEKEEDHKKDETELNSTDLNKLRGLGNTRDLSQTTKNESKVEIQDKVTHYELNEATKVKLRVIVAKNIEKIQSLVTSGNSNYNPNSTPVNQQSQNTLEQTSLESNIETNSESNLEPELKKIQEQLKLDLLEVYNDLPFETMNPTIARMDTKWDLSQLKFATNLPELALQAMEFFVLEELLEVIIISILVLGVEGFFSNAAKIIWSVRFLFGLAYIEAFLTLDIKAIIGLGFLYTIYVYAGGTLAVLCEMIDPVWRFTLQVPCMPITYTACRYYEQEYYPTLRPRTYIKELVPDMPNWRLNFFPEIGLDEATLDEVHSRVEKARSELIDPNSWDLSTWRKEQDYLGSMQLLEMLEEGQKFELGSSGPNMLYMCCLLLKNQMTSKALNATRNLAQTGEFVIRRSIWELKYLHSTKTKKGELLEYDKAESRETESSKSIKEFRKNLKITRSEERPELSDPKSTDILFKAVSEIRFWTCIIKCNYLLGWMQWKTNKEKDYGGKPDWNQIVADAREGKTNTYINQNCQPGYKRPTASETIKNEMNDLWSGTKSKANSIKSSVKGQGFKDIAEKVKQANQYATNQTKEADKSKVTEDLKNVLQSLKTKYTEANLPRIRKRREYEANPDLNTKDKTKPVQNHPPNKFY